MRKTRKLVRGYYRKDGKYVPPYSKDVYVADDGRTEDVRGGLGSVLDSALEEGDFEDYSDHMAPGSYYMDMEDMSFGPKGEVENTGKWEDPPVLRGCEINGKVKLHGEAKIIDSVMKGSRFSAYGNGLELNNCTFLSGSRADFNGVAADNVKVGSGSDVRMQGITLSNTNISGKVIVNGFGDKQEDDQVKNTVIKSDKSKYSRITFRDSRMQDCAVTLDGSGAFSSSGVTVRDSEIFVPDGSSAGVFNRSYLEEGENLKLQNVQCVMKTVVNKHDYDVTVTAAHRDNGNAKSTAEDFDTVFVYDGAEAHKLERKDDGGYEVVATAPRNMWARGFREEDIISNAVMVAERYARNNGY